MKNIEFITKKHWEGLFNDGITTILLPYQNEIMLVIERELENIYSNLWINPEDNSKRWFRWSMDVEDFVNKQLAWVSKSIISIWWLRWDAGSIYRIVCSFFDSKKYLLQDLISENTKLWIQRCNWTKDPDWSATIYSSYPEKTDKISTIEVDTWVWDKISRWISPTKVQIQNWKIISIDYGFSWERKDLMHDCKSLWKKLPCPEDELIRLANTYIAMEQKMWYSLNGEVTAKDWDVYNVQLRPVPPIITTDWETVNDIQIPAKNTKLCDLSFVSQKPVDVTSHAVFVSNNFVSDWWKEYISWIDNDTQIIIINWNMERSIIRKIAKIYPQIKVMISPYHGAALCHSWTLNDINSRNRFTIVWMPNLIYHLPQLLDTNNTLWNNYRSKCPITIKSDWRQWVMSVSKTDIKNYLGWEVPDVLSIWAELSEKFHIGSKKKLIFE